MSLTSDRYHFYLFLICIDSTAKYKINNHLTNNYLEDQVQQWTTHRGTDWTGLSDWTVRQSSSEVAMAGWYVENGTAGTSLTAGGMAHTVFLCSGGWNSLSSETSEMNKNVMYISEDVKKVSIKSGFFSFPTVCTCVLTTQKTILLRWYFWVPTTCFNWKKNKNMKVNINSDNSKCLD